jgi:hypothetical protein
MNPITELPQQEAHSAANSRWLSVKRGFTAGAIFGLLY